LKDWNKTKQWNSGFWHVFLKTKVSLSFPEKHWTAFDANDKTQVSEGKWDVDLHWETVHELKGFSDETGGDNSQMWFYANST
jgi:hypothetical protein